MHGSKHFLKVTGASKKHKEDKGLWFGVGSSITGEQFVAALKYLLCSPPLSGHLHAFVSMMQPPDHLKDDIGQSRCCMYESKRKTGGGIICL